MTQVLDTVQQDAGFENEIGWIPRKIIREELLSPGSKREKAPKDTGSIHLTPCVKPQPRRFASVR